MKSTRTQGAENAPKDFEKTFSKLRTEDRIDDRIRCRAEGDEKHGDGQKVRCSNEVRCWTEELSVEKGEDQDLRSEREKVDDHNDGEHLDHTSTRFQSIVTHAGSTLQINGLNERFSRIERRGATLLRSHGRQISSIIEI